MTHLITTAFGPIVDRSEVVTRESEANICRGRKGQISPLFCGRNRNLGVILRLKIEILRYTMNFQALILMRYS